jgi:hypothetical protein
MKRIGDSGSPWRKPLACFIRLPEISFKRILEEEDASKVVLTVKIRQPSHEFTFGVGMSFILYPLVLTPVV